MFEVQYRPYRETLGYNTQRGNIKTLILMEFDFPVETRHRNKLLYFHRH